MTEKTEHTEGEWSSVEVPEVDKILEDGSVTHTGRQKQLVKSVYRDEQGRRCTRFVAEILVQSGRPEEHKANARLIAAAPDLLAVVEELEESSGYWSEYDVPLGIVDRIKAVIAKARGQS